MQRKVYLVGELAEKFGSSFTVYASTYSEVFKCLEVNHPTFKRYLLDAEERGIGFTLETAGKFEEDEKDLLLPLRQGDITFAALPAGSKSGGAKIFAALVLAFFVLPMIGASGFVGPGMTTMEGISAAMATTAGQAVGMLSLNLALTGIQQLMAPDPSVDTQATNYLFNGSEQNIVEGDPVPLLYGELRVPGRAVSLHVSPNGGYTTNNYITDYSRNLIGLPAQEFDIPPETYTKDL